MARQKRDSTRRQLRPPRRKLRLEPLERRDLLAAFTTLEDTPLLVADAGLAGATIQVQPARGSLTLNTTGGFTYAPALNYHGPDSFVYRPAADSPAAASATISLEITSVNDFPDIYPRLIGAVQGQRTTAEAPWGLLPSQYDFEGDQLQVHLVSGPEHGTLSLNSDGSYAYQSNPDFWGVDHFVYRVSDGHTAAEVGIATATVSVKSVNDLPQAYDDYYNITQDEVLRADNPSVIRNNGTHAAGVTTTLVNGPSHGTVALAPNGKFTYTPDPGFNGVVQFTYKINDPAASTYPQVPSDATENDQAAYRSILPRTLGTLRINVGTIIGDPRATGDTYAVLENGELSVGGPGLLANDSPAYRQGNIPEPVGLLTAAIHEAPSHGTVIVNADGSFTYRPNPGLVGLDEFRYKVTDPGTNDLPNQYGPHYDPTIGMVRIFVTKVAPPLAIADDYNAVQDQLLERSGPYSVLGNDVGAGRPLTATLKTGPAHGTVTLRPDGDFTYTPAPGFFGIDSFTYRASDGTAISPSANDLPGFSNIATVTLFVNATGPAIVARDDVFATAEDTQLDTTDGGVLRNDHPPSFRKLEPPNCSGAITHGIYYYPTTHVAFLVEGPRHGTLTLKQDGTFEYAPAAGFTGTDSFTYRVRTEIGYAGFTQEVGLSEVATASIEVNPRNHAPTATNDTYRVLEGVPLTIAPASGVMKNDTPSSSANHVVLVSGPSRGTLTLNPDGSFNYTPGPGFSAYDSFSYRLRDDAPASGGPYFSNIAYVTLNGVANTLAIGATGDRYTTIRDTSLNVGAEGVLKNDFQLPRLDSIAFGSSGHLIAWSGCGSFGPSRHADVPLTVTVESGPQHGTLTLRPDGTFDYTPEAGFTGIDTFTYRASGPPRFPSEVTLTGPEGTVTYPQPVEPLPHAVATVVIVVRDPGQQPIFLLQDRHESTDESGPQRIAGWAALPIEGTAGNLASGQRYDVSTDRPELFAQLPAIDAAGQLIYTPAPNVTGTAIVTVKLVNNEGNLSAARSFTINITKPHPFYNAANPNDVDRDHAVSPADALTIINHLNGHELQGALFYYDTNADGLVTPIDALIVINHLNDSTAGATGVSPVSPSSTSAEGESPTLDDSIALLALDTANQSLRRKRA